MEGIKNTHTEIINENIKISKDKIENFKYNLKYVMLWLKNIEKEELKNIKNDIEQTKKSAE